MHHCVCVCFAWAETINHVLLPNTHTHTRTKYGHHFNLQAYFGMYTCVRECVCVEIGGSAVCEVLAVDYTPHTRAWIQAAVWHDLMGLQWEGCVCHHSHSIPPHRCSWRSLHAYLRVCVCVFVVMHLTLHAFFLSWQMLKRPQVWNFFHLICFQFGFGSCVRRFKCHTKTAFLHFPAV